MCWFLMMICRGNRGFCHRTEDKSGDKFSPRGERLMRHSSNVGVRKVFMMKFFAVQRGFRGDV